ncbi:hypothetical protein QBC40DRAFT_289428 [Triangularia verruculosa]|uniref:Uncharacterized protein n=1 Tax=Triangularia verruculosa TaxID=2587418 RepID=A0AAN7AQX9_9PEZI|nr:hypothetical protein QBC40DRAFT_289428 [Triangularia verruculosa]
MNFGSQADGAALRNTQQPTYHLAPNFTTRPFPDGPLDLGTVIEDLQSFYPINQGTSRITVPDGQRYVDVKEDVTASTKASASSSGEASFLAKVLDASIGGDASLGGQRSEENVYTVARLETVCFYPSPSYIKQCLQLPNVKDYLDMSNYKAPVYLITGLKIAWGATVSTERGRGFTGSVGASTQLPTGLVDVEIGAQAAVSRESGTISSFGKPADFVLGIQVLKLYHKRAFFIIGRPFLATKRVVRNAVLVDDEPVPEEEDEEETFVITEIGEGDVDGFIPTHIGGGDETWLIPRDLA